MFVDYGNASFGTNGRHSITVFSPILVLVPILIGNLSAITTEPNENRVFAAAYTLPTIVALGATYEVEDSDGCLSYKLKIFLCLFNG
jgi:hypothetical protein